MATIAKNAEGDDGKVAFIPGVLRVQGEAYYSSVVPVAVILQFFCFLFFGSIGDFGVMKKRLLMGSRKEKMKAFFFSFLIFFM